MKFYNISLHHLKTSIDGWPIVRNHREFLSCTVTSFSFTGMETDNSKRKGVLENCSSLFPIRKCLWFVPSLQYIFTSSTICPGPRSGSASKKLLCSPKQFSVCPSPAEINEVHTNASRGSQTFQASLSRHLPACGMRKAEGVP